MSPAIFFLNLLLFQVGWFAGVLGAAQGLYWAGVAAAAGVAAWHLWKAHRPWQELKLLVLAMAVGAAFDTALVQLGWLRFDDGVLAIGVAPVWMVALWSNFATTLNVSLRALRERLLLAVVLGAVGAPLAYYAGSRIGAVGFGEPAIALAAIAAGWAIMTPLLFLAARRFDGYAPR
jgi:hypothetical protein